jgi:diketogulonate reductase-like aldo/keto reductase
METISTERIPTRPLGRSGLTVSALGVGTWALGGPFTFDGRDAGWGAVDDDVSIRALHTAIDAGVTLIDSAPTYGIGHSERIVGRALAALPASTRDWAGMPQTTIALLARLQNTPYELHEAAALDGAGTWERFKNVTWPSIKPVAETP